MDRRAHPRITLNVPMRIDAESRKDRFGITRNVSARGVQFHSPSAFAVGDRLDVALFGLGAPPEGVALSTGTVVRVEKNDRLPPSIFPHITALVLDSEIPTEPTPCAAGA